MFKKSFMILILSFLLFSGVQQVTSAEKSINLTEDPLWPHLIMNDELLNVDLGPRDLTQEQINDLIKDPEKLKIRTELDTKYLLDESEKEMNKASSQYSKQLLEEATSSSNEISIQVVTGNDIFIGTDANYYASDTGNNGISKDLISGANSRYATWSSDSECWTAGIGSASAWAYNAKTINVKGTGSKLAYVRFRGNYSGSTAPGFMGGNASARIRVSVYDLTADSEIGGTIIKNISDSVSSGSSFNQVLYNNSVLVNLQAGHSYLLRYGVSTSTSNYSPQLVGSDFWSDSSHGIYQDYVTVDWQ